MSDSTTTNLGLTKPAVGGSLDSWGGKLNADLGQLDGLIFNLMPIGAIADYAGGVLAPGWLLCNGSPVLRATYSDLFAAIGTAFGAGDGTTTFNLPDLRGRFSVGAGTGNDGTTSVTFALGASQGNYSVIIALANLPNYALPVGPSGAGDGAHQHNYVQAAPAYIAAASSSNSGQSVLSATVTGTVMDGTAVHSHAVSLAGGAQALNIQSPLLALQRCIFAGKQAMQ